VAGKIGEINCVLKGHWKIEPFRRPFRTLTFLNRNQPRCGWLISDVALRLEMLSGHFRNALYLLKPLFTLRDGNFANRAKRSEFDRLDAAKFQDDFFDLVVPRLFVNKPVIPNRRIHGHNGVRASSGQQLVHKWGIFAILEGVSRQ
jgi:hypothetical protein